MGHFLQTIQRSYVIQRVYWRRETTVKAKYLLNFQILSHRISKSDDNEQSQQTWESTKAVSGR